MEKGYVTCPTGDIHWSKQKKTYTMWDTEVLSGIRGMRSFRPTFVNIEAYRCPHCKIVLFSYGNEKESESKEGEKPPSDYSAELVAKYTELYPHNPDGVIEVHIRRKVKAGKTRDEAIEELEAESRRRAT